MINSPILHYILSGLCMLDAYNLIVEIDYRPQDKLVIRLDPDLFDNDHLKNHKEEHDGLLRKGWRLEIKEEVVGTKECFYVFNL